MLVGGLVYSILLVHNPSRYKGNKATDEAARLGAENKNKNIQLIKTPVPSKTTKNKIDEAIRQELTRKWQNSTQYLQTY